jgi:hypothetical protein
MQGRGKKNVQGKIQLRRPRWEDAIRMDLREIGWGEGGSGFNWLRIYGRLL